MAAAVGIALTAPIGAWAQQDRPLDANSGADPKSMTYRSAFEGYRAQAETKVGDWRELNEEVARVGGHAGVMRGAGSTTAAGGGGHAGHATPGATPPPAPATDPGAVRSGTAPTPSPAGAGGHAGHGGHGSK